MYHCQSYHLQIFSTILQVAFSFFFHGFLCHANLLGLMRSQLFIFAFVSFVQQADTEKILPKSVLPMFSSRNFMASYFTFRSLIHFEFFFFKYIVRKCSKITFYMQLFSFPSTTFEEIFFHCTFLPPLLQIIDHRYMGLFLDSLVCFINLSSLNICNNNIIKYMICK